MHAHRSPRAVAGVVALIVLAVAPPVSATPLNSGGCVGITPPCLPPLPVFADPLGANLASVTVPIAPISNAFTGTLRAAVFATGDPNLPLEFDYQFSNFGPGDVHRITGNNFTGFITDVGFRVAGPSPFVGGTQPPLFADRDLDGSTVGFNFNSALVGDENLAINGGETSLILAIKTNATAFMLFSFFSPKILKP